MTTTTDPRTGGTGGTGTDVTGTGTDGTGTGGTDVTGTGVAPTPLPGGTTVPSGGVRGFTVRPAALHGAAGCLDAEADSLHNATAALDAALGGTNGCWGDDVVGRRFAAAYEPAARTVLDNLDALSTGLARIAAALRAVADGYERADHAVAAAQVGP